MHWDDPGARIIRGDGTRRGRVLVLNGAHAETLIRAVDHAHLDCWHASDATECLALVQSVKPDLVICDPDALPASLAAFEADVAAARRTESLPVLKLLLSGDAGAAPVATDGCSDLAQVFLAIRAALRRDRPSALKGRRENGAFVLDEAGFMLHHGARSVALGRTDLCVLGPFFDLRDAVFDRETLERLAFDQTDWREGNRTMDAHVSRTRRKVKAQIGCDPLRTVRGVGYALAQA